MAADSLPPQTGFEEWAYRQDDTGIVFCLGRSAAAGFREAIATYIESSPEDATKWSIDGSSTYRRLMYHGFKEEEPKLREIPAAAAEVLKGLVSVTDTCLYVNEASLEQRDSKYRDIDHWLNHTHAQTAQFREALERACSSLNPSLLPPASLSLYGGAAFGLFGDPSKRVEDVDFLVDGSTRDIYAQVQELQTAYDWSDINPFKNLSDRRQRLKAKRWSTSQIRILSPDFLSIDLKAIRPEGAPSLWDELQEDTGQTPFEGRLKVIDDSETFCISPAVRCEDEKGAVKTVLCRGYPYIGCAMVNDIIQVRGTLYEDTSCIVVTQSENDDLLPDFKNVPVS